MYGVPAVVALNSFITDTEAETKAVEEFCVSHGCAFSKATVWAEGGKGGIDLAKKVIATLEEKESHYAPIYPLEMPLKQKFETVAKEIYGADGAAFTAAALKQIDTLEKQGFGNLPVCIAKTQYSLSDDQTKLGRPTGYDLNVREVYVSAGAGFVVALTGTIMARPGLPKRPAACSIDVDADGKITGLF